MHQCPGIIGASCPGSGLVPAQPNSQSQAVWGSLVLAGPYRVQAQGYCYLFTLMPCGHLMSNFSAGRVGVPACVKKWLA